jgi:hypothetical protein
LENNYTGTLEYKGIEFFFIFDGARLSLIPPKEKRNEIKWHWIYTEIEPGVYILGDPLIIDVPFLQGQCAESGRSMVFLTRVGSFINCRNTTLYFDVAGVIECQTSNTKYSRMSLSNIELNYIHSINRAFSQEFNLDDLKESGALAIKTCEFDKTTTEKKQFNFKGKVVTFYFSIGWKSSLNISNPPILFNSSIIFEFQETNDYWYLFELYQLAKKFVQFLTFRKNCYFKESSLQVKYDNNYYQDAAIFHIINSEPLEIDVSLEKGRYISLDRLESKEEMLLSLISEDSLYLNHLPKSFEVEESLDAAVFVLTSAAFEWEFEKLYPDGVVKEYKTTKTEEKALEEMNKLISNTTGKVKKILKKCRKTIGLMNLETKIILAGTDLNSIVEQFGRRLYDLNNKKFDYKTIGNRLANQRNDFAHGNIDKEFVGESILDLIFLRYLIYAMQLKRIGISDFSIKNAINELFDTSLNFQK